MHQPCCTCAVSHKENKDVKAFVMSITLHGQGPSAAAEGQEGIA